MLVRAFGHRYLRRASWVSRQQFIDHVVVSWPEYNQLYAHPFDWTWSNQQMRTWFAEHKPLNFLQDFVAGPLWRL